MNHKLNKYSPQFLLFILSWTPLSAQTPFLLDVQQIQEVVDASDALPRPGNELTFSTYTNRSLDRSMQTEELFTPNWADAVADANIDASALNERYKWGKDALNKIIDGIADINLVLGIANLEQGLGLGTNIWADEEFRSLFDKLDDWGSTIGLGIATLSLSMPSEDAGSLPQIGMGLAAISKLVGVLFGTQNGSKFEEKTKHLEFTRSAYDDLRERYDLTAMYVKRNEVFSSELEKFVTDIYSAANTPQEKKVALIRATPFIARYDDTLLQILNLLSVYEKIINDYCPEALIAINPLNSNCVTLIGTVPYTLSGDSRDKIISAASKLKSLKANEGRTKNLLSLSAKMRSAFLAIG